MHTDTDLAIRPLKAGFGAEIQGVDLCRASGAAVRGVVDAFQRHGAILLRDQQLGPEDLLAFVREILAVNATAAA